MPDMDVDEVVVTHPRFTPPDLVDEVPAGPDHTGREDSAANMSNSVRVNEIGCVSTNT